MLRVELASLWHDAGHDVVRASEPGQARADDALILRACFEIRFGVPPLGGTVPKPPEGGTPNPEAHLQTGFSKHALSAAHPFGKSFGKGGALASGNAHTMESGDCFPADVSLRVE